MAHSLTVGRIEFGPWPGSRDLAMPGEAVAVAKLKRLQVLLDHAGQREAKDLLAEIRRIVAA